MNMYIILSSNARPCHAVTLLIFLLLVRMPSLNAKPPYIPFKKSKKINTIYIFLSNMYMFLSNMYIILSNAGPYAVTLLLFLLLACLTSLNARTIFRFAVSHDSYTASPFQLLITYLNERLASVFTPPVALQLVIYNDTHPLEDLLERGQTDFYLGSSADTVCYGEKYETTPIATVSRSLAGEPMTGYGGVFVIRANDYRIDALQKIRDKIIVAEPPVSQGGCMLHWRELTASKVREIILCMYVCMCVSK
jgi:hypothetical protein